MEPTKQEILAGYGRARRELRMWLEGASPAGLHHKSDGTRWTNEELLFHMVFGYMVVRALLPWSASSAVFPHRRAGRSPRS